MNLEHKITIDDLLEGCKRGERKAQELLYRALSSKMLGVCTRYANSDFEAEDMLQAGFIKVFRSVESFRGEGSFEGWIRKVIVNTAIEMYRKNIRTLKTVDMNEIYDAEQQTYHIDQLELNDLLKIIQLLPDGYRIVFNMYAIEGYSHKEIAAALHISEGASKSQLSRARTWLKEKIKETEGGSYGINAG